ncbi:hypothetical protein KC217_22705, partial [Mycobacterium tuberculosis]|nr:hypothetical protein [Mycobacterium tuberculosis]
MVEVVARAWSFALRLPAFGASGEDEAFVVVVGENWLHGLQPYQHAFDVKPPGLFALAALGAALFGPTVASIKILTT